MASIRDVVERSSTGGKIEPTSPRLDTTTSRAAPGRRVARAPRRGHIETPAPDHRPQRPSHLTASRYAAARSSQRLLDEQSGRSRSSSSPSPQARAYRDARTRPPTPTPKPPHRVSIRRRSFLATATRRPDRAAPGRRVARAPRRGHIETPAPDHRPRRPSHLTASRYAAARSSQRLLDEQAGRSRSSSSPSPQARAYRDARTRPPTPTPKPPHRVSIRRRSFLATATRRPVGATPGRRVARAQARAYRDARDPTTDPNAQATSPRLDTPPLVPRNGYSTTSRATPGRRVARAPRRGHIETPTPRRQPRRRSPHRVSIRRRSFLATATRRPAALPVVE